MTIELGVALRGSKCRVQSAAQRILARDGEHYVYADASVVCGALELGRGTTDVLANPEVVIEALSKRPRSMIAG